jgi:hypothetical protein
MAIHRDRAAVRAVGIAVAILIAALEAFLGTPVAAAHRARVHTRATLALAPAAGPIHSTVLVRGSGFPPDARGIILFGRRRVASFESARRGGFLVRLRVPSGAHGSVRVRAEQRVHGRGGTWRWVTSATARFRVRPGASRGTLPAGNRGGGAGGGVLGGGGSGSGAGAWWLPPQRLTWYWRLQGAVNNSEPVAAYDIDGFETSAAEVAALHAEGKHVVCYIDVGTYEPGRPDAGQLPSAVLGNEVQGWPGERWLDIADVGVLEPIMTKRLAMCRAKGFDAVEPDNMEGFENNTGFPITRQQQVTYDDWVAAEVHSLGMAVLQKNDGGQTAGLEPHFDGALTEQCNQYHECDKFQPYLSAGKPVLNAEYGLSTSQFCSADNSAGIMGARFDMELNGGLFEPCW